LRRFLRTHPDVEDYARFRATTERRGGVWPEWPARLREGRLRQGDYSPASARYHEFVQWLATEQLSAVAGAADGRGVRLYLDLPLGAHPAGYDVWRQPELFATGASAGSPPDAFFTGGQLWNFPPVRPERSRAEGHRYFGSCLRHHMRPAGMLRIDHVMSLHRLFWVPEGHAADDGVYVRYPADELYAVVCLESWRQRCVVVGEDLGTVARDVRPAMKRSGLRGTFVLPYGRSSNPRRPLESMKARGVAALRTHDMPTFAAFWRGLDIGRRVKLGHLAPGDAPRHREARRTLRAAWTRDLRRGGWLGPKDPGTAEALRACLAFLADGTADVVLVDLEDLWGETEPHNVPGTSGDWPNWRRKARHPLEALGTLRKVADALRDLRARRAGARHR
jgi:4-alpha-glucanotransferase